MTRRSDRHRTRCKHAFLHSTPEERAVVCAYAARTTSAMAARKYGRSDHRIRVWMKQLGIPRRRVGNLTNAEVMALKEVA